MKNNTATLDCNTKLITFCFQNELFIVDITEGDLSDSWNSITTSNGEVFDFNFSWEDDKDCKPSLSIYGLEDDGDGGLQINTFDDTMITILGKPSADVFFSEERFKYKFDVSSPITAKVYNENDEVIFKTKSFNRLSDELYIRKSQGEKVYAVIMDKNNAKKRLD
jgi:hypothetical protein